jgi:uncharacterized protein
VLDNNVLISAALLKNSTPDLTFRRAKANGIILSSDEALRELFNVLMKDKFNKYVDVEARLEFLLEVKEISKIIHIDQRVSVCRDPKDNMYLELALSGKADVVITGDHDLLILHPFRNIPVITPKDFLDKL